MDTPALVSLQGPSWDAKPLHLDWNMGREGGRTLVGEAFGRTGMPAVL